MPEWNFINGLNGIKIDDIDGRWSLALNLSLQANPTPLQSNYHVRVGGVTKNGNGVIGSNHEMGKTDSITHGEEALISSALEKYEIYDPLQVIAFTNQNTNEITTPCGNCRDAIRQYTNLENLVIINAPSEGGNAFLIPGKAYFKFNYDEIKFDNSKRGVINEAIKAITSAYDIYSSETSPKIYGAVIVCKNGSLFRGSFRGDAAYHPVLPISAAISNFRDGSNDLNRRFIKEIVIVSIGNIPDVMYKDRQHALEFSEAIQSLNGKEGIPLPIYLVNKYNGGEKMFKTNTYEWLPFPFSPKNLGLEKKMKENYRKLFRE